MDVHITTAVNVNNDPTPDHNEYIRDEYEIQEEAKQVILTQLIRGADEYRLNATTHKFENFVRYLHTEIIRKPKPSISSEVESDANDIINDYALKEIIEQLIDTEETSTILYNDYTDLSSIINESDNYWRHPEDAIELIQELSEYEEEDSILWEGSSGYSDILNAIAHYTYLNALYANIVEKIEEINEIDMDEIRTKATEAILDESDDSHMENDGVDIGDIDEIIEWCEDNLPDQFNDAMKKILEKEIKEILE